MDSNLAAPSFDNLANNPVVDEETRARNATRRRRLLMDEVAALRLRVADLRNVRADFGFPPPPPVARPTGNARDEKEFKKMYLGPKPVCPADSRVGKRRYQSMLAQRAFRWRKVKKDEEEVAALRAEVLDFSVQMRRVGARL
jgi:hypothetical protein